MDQIQSLYDTLQADPENWDLRMQLLEILVGQGSAEHAHQVLSEAPSIPEHAHGVLSAWGLIELSDDGGAQDVVAVEDDLGDFAQPVVALEEPAGEDIVPVVPVGSLHRTSAHDIAKIAPLVDPASVPGKHKLHVDAAAGHHEPHLNYVPSEQLSASRRHLAVYSGDGSPIDADLLAEHGIDDLEYGHHEPVIMVAEGGYIPHAARADDTKEKAGAVLTTILVHVAIALLLWVLVISIPEPKAPEIVATTIPANTENKVTKRQLARAVQKTPSAPSNQSVAVITAATSSNVSAPTIEFTEVTETVELGSSFGAGLGFGGAGSGFGGGFAVPAAMKSRCTAAERARMRQKHGGSQLGDQRINAALKYLQSQQADDGSWGDDYKAAMTGLSLLCYLGYCVTPDHPEYGETVMKGIMYLVEFHKNDQRLYATSNDHGQAYEHGIATYALGETYAIARLGKRKLPGMKEAFEQGVQTIIDGQNPDGGWSYGYPARGAIDTSVTGWQYQALKAAKHTSLKFSGLATSIKKAQQYLDDIQDRNNGMFPYRPGQPGKPSLAGAGVLGLQMLGGQGYEDEIKKGLDSIVGGIKGKKWASANLYEWYYNTQACFEGGGDAWKEWNAMFQDEIIKNQESNGSWVERRRQPRRAQHLLHLPLHPHARGLLPLPPRRIRQVVPATIRLLECANTGRPGPLSRAHTPNIARRPLKLP